MHARVEMQSLRKRFATTSRAWPKRGVHEVEALAVIDIGVVVEEHPNHPPNPRVLFMAEINGEPLYCTFRAHSMGRVFLWFIVYDRNEWIDPWTRRN